MIPVEFERKNLSCCDVEISDSGEDIVYHFWPSEGNADFPEGFSEDLEKAFQSVLPEDADVRASYTSQEEASIISKFGNPDAPPVPSYYVRVVGWANNPMAAKFLKQKVFVSLDENVQLRQ